jgi:Raf kinase inhibitor-like YbhB/YbcL family protein
MRRWVAAISVCVASSTLGCDKAAEPAPSGSAQPSEPEAKKELPPEIPPSFMTLTSTAFEPNGAIPKKYTCEGQDVSPPLAWNQLPELTKSLVLILDDPDAPDPAAPKMTWVHWVLYNIPPRTEGLSEGAKDRPSSAADGWNDWKRKGYQGPCPPKGRHRYVHKLYALDMVVSGLDHPTKSDIERVMKGHILGKAELIGTYQKGD